MFKSLDNNLTINLFLHIFNLKRKNLNLYQQIDHYILFYFNYKIFLEWTSILCEGAHFSVKLGLMPLFSGSQSILLHLKSEEV